VNGSAIGLAAPLRRRRDAGEDMGWTPHLLSAPDWYWPSTVRSGATDRVEPATRLDLLLASPRDRVPVAIEMDPRLLVHERIKGSPQVATHRRLHPRGELRERCALVATLVQQYQATRACRKFGAQHLEEPVEVLNHRGLPRHQVVDHAPRLVRSDVVVEPHELGKDPIQYANNESRVLQVRVNAVVGGVPVVSYVVYDPECPWDVKAHGIGLRASR
jgi:hypothetical protein